MRSCALWNAYRPKSNRLPDSASPSRVACFSSRCRPLHAAVLQVGGQGADLPVSGANVGRVPQEVGEFPGVQAGLTLLARLQQLVAARAEPGVQFFQKGQGTGGQDAAGVRVRLMLDSVSGGLRHLRFSSG